MRFYELLRELNDPYRRQSFSEIRLSRIDNYDITSSRGMSTYLGEENLYLVDMELSEPDEFIAIRRG